MPFVKYIDYKPRGEFQITVLHHAYEICSEMFERGYRLTVRQLHYQFVARGLYENTQENYTALGTIVAKGRRAGMLDWDWIEDRTRGQRSIQHWTSPAERINAAVNGYATDKWLGQQNRPEVWIEKDALVGVIEGICRTNDIGYMSTRGYCSDSEMWAAAQRFRAYEEEGQLPIVLHFADHDPSGLDMTEDIKKRLGMFVTQAVVVRMALTIDQVRHYNPPPNFVKLTDSRSGVVRDKAKNIVGIRADSYIDKFSRLDASHSAAERARNTDSWELDALDPSVIARRIQDAVDKLRDEALWEDAQAEQEHQRRQLRQLAQYATPEGQSKIARGNIALTILKKRKRDGK